MNPLYNRRVLRERRRELRHTQTEAEQKLWKHLRNKRLNGCKFYRQFSVDCYILDFYCPVKKLAIELDGSQHNEPHNQAYDLIRTKYLNTIGIQVIRFWNNEVFENVEGVLEILEQKLT